MSLVVPGVVLGWALCLAWIPLKGWRFVVSREIKETVLDVAVMPAFLFLVALALRPLYEKAEEPDDSAMASDDDGPPIWAPPIDEMPEDQESDGDEPIGSYVNMKMGFNDFAKAPPAFHKAMAAAFDPTLLALQFSYLIQVLALTCSNLVAYLAGQWLSATSPVPSLVEVGAWTI